MEVVKHEHACVSLVAAGRRLVVDPGIWTDPGVLEVADAVLVTHAHVDHVDEPALRAALGGRPELHVWTNPELARALAGPSGQVHAVREGDRFEAAGLAVRVVGEQHAVIHPEVPRVANVGFVVEERFFHPGDALLDPGVPLELLCVPLHGPWVKVAELVDWVRRLAPRRTLAVHDGLLNARGLAVVGRFLGPEGPGTGAEHVRLEPGESLLLA